MKTDNSQPLDPQTGENITYLNYSDTAGNAGFMSFEPTIEDLFPHSSITFRPIFFLANKITGIIQPAKEDLDDIHDSSFLKLAESAFGFWDNDEDALYDSL